MAHNTVQAVVSSADKRVIDLLITDLISLSYECKRKYPPVKEASEACQLKLRSIAAKADQIPHGLLESSVDVIQPFLLGCDTKNPKIVQLCLGTTQRLISQQLLNASAAANVVNTLWVLMEAGVEELKLLQTAILLITTSAVVQHEILSRALVLCFRMHFAKDVTTTNTAAATIRQLVSVVFERVITEDATPTQDVVESISLEQLKTNGKLPPKSLRPLASDAYLLFQDLCQLLNAEQPHWLLGMTEMTRTLCLELMEEILCSYSAIFIQHAEFSFLLTEKVCPLVIRLFSPSLKYRTRSVGSSSPAVPAEKPYFPIVMRLLRIVSVLTRNYYKLLVTECEIFLSLLIKFLDPEKPQWQRVTALEVLAKLSVQPQLIRNFCECYDMREHSTKVTRDIISGLAAYIQSQFVASGTQNAGKPPDTVNSQQTVATGATSSVIYTPQPSFLYRGTWIPLILNIAAPPGSHRTLFLDMIDKTEPPPVAEGYGLSLAFVCILDIVRSVQLVASSVPATPSSDQDVALEKPIKEELIYSSWSGVLSALSLLLDASCDETASEAILKSLQIYSTLCGNLSMLPARDAFIVALCKSTLPANYALHVITSLPDLKGLGGRNSDLAVAVNQNDTPNGNQVVAVGVALATLSTSVSSYQGPISLTAKNIQCMRTLLALAQCHGELLTTAWYPILSTFQHLSWVLGLKPVTGGGGILKPVQHASENPGSVITSALMSDLPILSANLSRVFENSQYTTREIMANSAFSQGFRHILHMTKLHSLLLETLTVMKQTSTLETYLDDVSLHHLIDALCKLSSEAMDIAIANKEPSVFAVAKLLETGLVNLFRVEILWAAVTRHLIEVCQHSNQSLRSWAAEAVTSLVKYALSSNKPGADHNKRQVRLLLPLQELCSVNHTDVRQRQLECILQILQNNAEQLTEGWPLVLGVIGDVTNGQGEGLVRTAFHSLQLIVTDFLPTIPCYCLPMCVDVTAKFGLQNQELNISLTAIGLLWNIADYFSQNNHRIQSQLPSEASTVKLLVGDQGSCAISSSVDGVASTLPGDQNSDSVVVFDALWMSLYMRLGDLCVDSRPAVRKSAGQTLFSMIAAHGSLLTLAAWNTIVWKVLFPLLDKVKKCSSQASDRRDESNLSGRSTSSGGTSIASGNILMHHSRDTAEKQWAETRFLTLAGVARVFSSKRHILQQLSEFLRAWAFLLEYIESAALCQNAEVSLAALKSFHEILNIPAMSDGSDDSLSSESNKSTDELKALFTARHEIHETVAKSASNGGVEESALWSQAWRVWRSIGTAVTNLPDPATGVLPSYIPSQAFLTTLVATFPSLFVHIRTQFVAAELQRLFIILQRALVVPVPTSSMSFFLMPVSNSSDSPGLMPLHDSVLGAAKVIIKEVLSGAENMPAMCPDLFERLLVFVDYSVHPPKLAKVQMKSSRNSQTDFVPVNFVPFAESVIDLIVELYRNTAKYPSVIHSHVLLHILHGLRGPLELKYACPSQSTWQLAINSLFAILSTGLPIARKHEAAFQGMWMELGLCLEEFLFSQQSPPESMTGEDIIRDEAIDCRVIQLIRDDILPNAAKLPRDFIAKLMQILNKGSIHSVTASSFIDVDSSRKLRESFAKSCFETLLQFSFVSQGGSTDSGAITQLAVKSLLDRCQSVLAKFVADERLSGKCPLPRPRMAELSFVLKAVTTLIATLKKTPSSSVDKTIWNQVIALYPSLVDCTTSQCVDVTLAVHDALIQYKDLLAPPTHCTNGVL